ncbi:hypothetical protein IQ264_25735 [Phormidium sp. LEGE 05292]|uniref:hypothetical protein n=1 Tax=[Phormidium] sp. LEGE 05292 TaxID=767427 RepID=UPI00187DFB46|nr:hypothetical protein [Phormidium sp. LEGE 05292]MBE9228817.1 hypothetical protein [Phormidium sp. LEGE 05292]
MLFNPVNLAYWIFLGMGVLLFILVIVSGGGDDDVELDADADIDVDADIGDSTTETVTSSLPPLPPKTQQNPTASKRQTPETPTTKKTVLVANPTPVNQPTEALETGKNEA